MNGGDRQVMVRDERDFGSDVGVDRTVDGVWRGVREGGLGGSWWAAESWVLREIHNFFRGWGGSGKRGRFGVAGEEGWGGKVSESVRGTW